jgi:glycosyltransferase involved in cell wall biosynthesis
MRIALLAEGCYPYVTGGVSTWCDQLVRGMPEHDFEVVAIAGTSGQQPAMAMPDNVLAVRCVPLWDWSGEGRRPRRRARAAFRVLYRPFLRAMLDVAVPADEFGRLLRDVFELAQTSDLTALLESRHALDTLVEVWAELHPDAPLSMRDALDATELIEHYLRPLSAPVLEADVCHAVSNGLPAMLALAAKWRHGTPIVMSEHGVYLRERYLSFRTIRYRWPVKVIMLAMFRRLCWTAYAAADVIAPVNVYNQRWEVRHGADPDVIATAYNGVSADSYPTATAEPETPTLGWVGRIDPLKDLETLIRAFGLVHERMPDAVLRLFGPTPAGNEEYEQELRDLITELRLVDVVTFEGPVRPVTAAYHASTVVALSSISEGLPYTVMEAMMCSRATVSTDVGGVPEVTGDAGLVVPPRDPEAFAEACVQLLSDHGMRHRMAAAARERALALFQLERMLTTFGETYRQVVRPTGSAAVTGTVVRRLSPVAAA